MPESEAPRRRTGGRSARVRRAVLTAAIELLSSEGADAATVPAIAARSGVHASSIYRRWGDRGGVLLDALLDAADEASPIPHTGDLRADFVALLSDVQRMFASPLGPAFVEIIVLASHDEGLAELRRTYWARRAGAMARIIEGAVDRGELPADTDPEFVLRLLVGPLHTQAVQHRETPDPELPARVVDSVLFGITTTAPQRRADLVRRSTA